MMFQEVRRRTGIISHKATEHVGNASRGSASLKDKNEK